MRYEVKFIKGRFLPYGNVQPDMTVLELALDYIQNPNHAERYCVAAIQRGGKGRPGAVKVLVYDRAAVLAAVLKFGANGRKFAPALGVHNGGIAVLRCEYAAIRQTFGLPIAEYGTGLNKREDLEPDMGCPNAPYARAWEKVCAKVMNGQWCGALRNVQIDFVVNDADD